MELTLLFAMKFVENIEIALYDEMLQGLNNLRNTNLIILMEFTHRYL